MKLLGIISKWLKIKMTKSFKLTDIDDNTWEILPDEIHTIIQDTYVIYVIYKEKGTYKTFPNTAPNRANLPSIRLGQELKFK